jgi:hypothetical protein
MSRIPAIVLSLLFSLTFLPPAVFAQGTAFTYQGRLNGGSSPANGNYDFTFALFSGGSTNSTQIGATQTNLAVAVNNGLFTATLDFGDIFTGNAAWLAIGVRGSGESSFTMLMPLQPVTPAPYALYAPSAGSVATNGTVPLAALPNSVLTNGASGVNLSGLFAGNGAGLSNTVTAGNYVFAHDDALSNGSVAIGQTKALAYSAVSMDGWTCITNTTFVCAHSGLYFVYHYTVVVTSGSLVMLAYNSRTGQIPGSAGFASGSGRFAISQSFIAYFNAGDTLQIQATAVTGGSANFAGPSNFTGPDATLTIVRIQ